MLAECEVLTLDQFEYYKVIPLRSPAHIVDPSLPFPPPAEDYADGSWTDWLDTQQLKKFPYLMSVIDHFRKHTKVTLVRLLRLAPGSVIKEPIPEYINGEKLIPDETYVLIGFYNNKKQYDWITDKKKYNFRMGSGNGSLILDQETVSAKYLLLHTHKDESSSELWKIVSKGPKVYSRLNLEKKGYPKAQKQEDYDKHYLVIDLERVNDSDFIDTNWDFKKLSNYNAGHAAAKPYTSTLTELMSLTKKIKPWKKTTHKSSFIKPKVERQN